MSRPPLINAVMTPQCVAVMLEAWDAAPGRYFSGYRHRGGFRMLLGQGVVDEFCTVSAPILVAPAALLGDVYDVGMRLADLRDVEAPIDQGWPPLTIGIEGLAVDAQAGWQAALLGALKAGKGEPAAPWPVHIGRSEAGDYGIEILRVTAGGATDASVIVTDAPLLPEQLERLADQDDAAVSIAVSTGNRLPRIEEGALQHARVASEQTLAALCRALQGIPGSA